MSITRFVQLIHTIDICTMLNYNSSNKGRGLETLRINRPWRALRVISDAVPGAQRYRAALWFAGLSGQRLLATGAADLHGRVRLSHSRRLRPWNTRQRRGKVISRWTCAVVCSLQLLGIAMDCAVEVGCTVCWQNCKLKTHLHWQKANAKVNFHWCLSLVSVDIKLDSLLTHLKVMSLSLSLFLSV